MTHILPRNTILAYMDAYSGAGRRVSMKVSEHTIPRYVYMVCSWMLPCRVFIRRGAVSQNGN